MNKRQQLNKNFSKRLVALLKEKGYASTTAASGVKVRVLAEKIACSLQIARKYTLGEALPEPEVIMEIARWLKVSPGWLLYGEHETQSQFLPASVMLDEKILKYILTKLVPIFKNQNNEKEIINFVMDIINDVQHIKANPEMIYKIVDIAVESAQRFSLKTHKAAMVI